MGNVGKNPHRPEGKADWDAPRQQAVTEKEGPPYTGGESDKHRRNLDQLNEAAGGPEELAADEAEHSKHQVGGSRPGVESRVKEALASREAREEGATTQRESEGPVYAEKQPREEEEQD